MVSLRDFCDYLEALYPLSLSEDYDNSGLLLSQGDIDLRGVLTTLDINCEVIKESISKNCNVILCHHPIFFKPLRCLNSSNEEQKSINLAIENNISIYCAHTNLDNSINGINYYVAKKFGLSNLKPIEKRYRYDKIDLFVNQELLSDVYDLLINVGYLLEGVEDVERKQKAIFYTNSIFFKYDLNQSMLSLFLDRSISLNIVTLIGEKYPKNLLFYRRDVDFLFQEGCGVVGIFSEGVKLSLLLEMVENFFCNKNFKYTTWIDLNSIINKLAICSGSGSSLLKSVIKSQADIYITSDLKYHDFLDNYKKLSIVDVGHYESEVFVKKIFKEALFNKFPSLPIFESEVNTNPVKFYI